MRTEKKQDLATRRHWRVRKKISGTKERPRMSVFFSNKNIHVQFIDDNARVTLAAASTTSKATPDREKLAANAVSAKSVGSLAAQAALAKGITGFGSFLFRRNRSTVDQARQDEELFI